MGILTKKDMEHLRNGAWYQKANEPISEEVKRQHAERHCPWELHALRMPIKK